jgi:hypothetical protein
VPLSQSPLLVSLQTESQHRTRTQLSQPLLSDSSLVEGQLIALENVAITPSTLTRPRRNNRIQSSSLKLSLQRLLNLAHRLHTLLSLPRHTLADLLVLDRLLPALLLPSPANAGAVVSFIPGTEGSGVDLHDSGFGEGVGADEFVVGGMEGYDDDTDFAGDALGAPAEVAGVETQGAIFGVAASDADEMDAFVADTGVGWLTTFLEGSVDVLGFGGD